MMNRKTFIQLTALTPFVGLGGLDNSTAKPGEILEPERKIPVLGEYDVIVSGAGPAGVSAAIEAGRNGAKTLLVEAHGCLGGVWTSGLLTWILDQANKSGFMRELEDHLTSRYAVSTDIDTGRVLSFDPEIMKLLLEDLCLEAGVEIIFHSRVVAAVKDNYQRLSHVVTESKSGREAWKGNVFIDTTGDGDLAALSGCGFDMGREGDSALQPFSLLALISGVTFDEISEFSRWAGDKGSASKKRLFEAIKNGGLVPSYMSPSIHPIRNDLFKLMVNHQYGFSPLNSREVTKATLQARKEINDIVNALKSTGGVWKNLKLIATAEQIGIREARRIHGLYTVTKEDLIKGARFEDAVCRVTFGVDVHSVSIKDEESRGAYNQSVKSKDYDIPLRSLIAKDVGGLMMAGRCISGDFIAHSSYRVTGNAVSMGQAAGRTAAYASKQNILPQAVKFQSIN
ncbi:MAG TPA: FAD-dependent oxidoreductase [Mariniphaga sp.]|nr:FAD-dependent oxidoreductase [Mariniphaga sp.]